MVEGPGRAIGVVERLGCERVGRGMEVKYEARNLAGRNHCEYQTTGTTRIENESYDVGRSFSLSVSAEF